MTIPDIRRALSDSAEARKTALADLRRVAIEGNADEREQAGRMLAELEGK